MRINPAVLPAAAMTECPVRRASGSSSSAATYSIAPAANARKPGRMRRTAPVSAMVSTPLSGSTAPDSTPSAKARPLLLPPLWSGSEMIAPSGSDVGAARQRAGECHAHRHAFGDIVERDRQHHHGGLPGTAVDRTDRVGAIVGQRGKTVEQTVEQQQPRNARQKSQRRRQPRDTPLLPGQLNGGQQQRPHRRGCHDARRQSQQKRLRSLLQTVAQKKHGQRPESGSGKGNHQSQTKRYTVRHGQRRIVP